MEILLHPDFERATAAAARRVAELVRARPESVLGLATGSSPLPLYRELIRMHREEGLDFSGVTTFNLDEYVGLPPSHSQSYRQVIWREFLHHVNVQPNRVHLPDGMGDDLEASCTAYERAIREAGGIDVQILGIGSDGHIGFNEPTSSLGSRTRVKTLDRATVRDNARFFAGEESRVPRHCLTMGIANILEAGEVLLLAFGTRKAAAVAAAVEGPVAAVCPASALQFHPAAKVYLDEEAAGELARREYYRWVAENKP